MEEGPQCQIVPKDRKIGHGYHRRQLPERRHFERYLQLQESPLPIIH